MGFTSNPSEAAISFVSEGWAEPLKIKVFGNAGVLELIAFIQETFELEVGDDDMVPENFDSVERIAKYLTRKTNG